MMSSGVMMVIAGTPGVPSFSGDSGQATMATLNEPLGILVSSTGDLLIADSGNHRIRKVCMCLLSNGFDSSNDTPSSQLSEQ